jgi:Malectin domain
LVTRLLDCFLATLRSNTISSILHWQLEGIAFTIFDPNTSTDLFELNNGSIVDPNEFDFKSSVIRAEVTKNPSRVDTFIFHIDGVWQPMVTRPPYILGGGLKPSGNPKQPILAPGKHRLFARAIFKNGRWKTRTIYFEVLDPTNAPTTVPSVSLTLKLVDSKTNEEIDMDALTEGAVIDLSKVGTALNIRAGIGYNVTTMDFWFDGDYIRTEFFAPFSLGGDNFGNYRSFSPLTVTGKHEINVRAFIGTELVGQRRIGFNVIDKTFTPTTTKYPTRSPEVGSDLPSDVPSDTPSDEPSTVPSDATSDEPLDSTFSVPSVSPSAVEREPTVKPFLSEYMTEYFVNAGATKNERKFLVGGKTQAYTNVDAIVTGADPYPASLFQTHRCANWMNYTFPKLEPQSMNQVKLGFAEVYDPNCLIGPGARSINVRVNDIFFLSNFDVLKVVPCYAAHFEEGIFFANEDGKITVAFEAATGEAFVSTIQINTVGSA